MRFLLVAALMLAPALAGCTASAAPLATAQELEGDAFDSAQAWADDAVLVAVVGIEGEYHGDEDVDDDAQAGADGDDRMDGRLERWSYRFYSEEKDDGYLVVMDENGTIVKARETFFDFEQPIGNYDVDSDEAIRIAKETNEGFASGLDGDKRGVFLRLAYDDGEDAPVWFLAGGSVDDDGWSAGVVGVHAITGDVLYEFGKS